jgi:hypothetical protein
MGTISADQKEIKAFREELEAAINAILTTQAKFRETINKRGGGHPDIC